MTRFLFSIAILFYCLAGCSSSLPSPKNNDSTLVVFYTELENVSSLLPFIRYDLLINPRDTANNPIKDKLVSLYPRSGLTYLSDLKPGEYAVTKITSAHLRGGSGGEQEIVMRFTIKSGQISFFPKKLNIFVKEIDPGGYDARFTQESQFEDLSPEDKSKINGFLKKEENYQLWQ